MISATSQTHLDCISKLVITVWSTTHVHNDNKPIDCIPDDIG